MLPLRKYSYHAVQIPLLKHTLWSLVRLFCLLVSKSNWGRNPKECSNRVRKLKWCWVCAALQQAANARWPLICPKSFRSISVTSFSVYFGSHNIASVLCPTLAERSPYSQLHLNLRIWCTDNHHVQIYWRAETSRFLYYRISLGRWWYRNNSCKAGVFKKHFPHHT